MGLVQVIIDDSTDKVVTGQYTFDRDNGGILVPGCGTSFPVSPVEGEWFWHTSENRLYRYDGAAWDAVIATAAAHATSHEPGGADAMVVDAGASTGSLRTIGTGALQACAGNDSRLSDARTPTAHETTHRNGGSDELAHQNLSGAGTNSHSQIDTHIGSTSNPHSVTKTQVGLGNVTDDAQLKRAAADFATFTEKATPVSADLLLIEDSAAAGAKKKVQVGNLPGGGGGTDVNAIHKNVSAEISTITAKTLIQREDLVVIEDSEAANAKKRVTVSNLLAAEPDFLVGNVRFFDEFFPPMLDDQWTTSVSGTGSLVEVGLLPGGQVLIRSGNAAGRSAELLFGGGVAWQSLGLYPRISSRMKYDGTSNGHVEFEVHYTDANNYVFLRADWGSNWILETRSGGVSTNVDTGVALDNAWHILEIRATPTQVDVYIDNVLKATSTTNIPTVSGTVSIYVSATGTGGTKNLLVDGFFYSSARPT